MYKAHIGYEGTSYQYTFLVPRSRSSAKIKVKYHGHVSQKMDVFGALVFHKHILFCIGNRMYIQVCTGISFDLRPRVLMLENRE